MPHARVVRFTDVGPDRVEQVIKQVEEAGGPPPGVDSTGMQLLYDESQQTAVFIGYFEDEQKLRDADQVFQQMDASDTPGNRVSVDQAEVKIERTA